MELKKIFQNFIFSHSKLTFSSFSTNVQFAWAINAGLISDVRFAEFRLATAAAELKAGGLPSIEISLARHLELPFLMRRKLLPLREGMKNIQKTKCSQNIYIYKKNYFNKSH